MRTSSDMWVADSAAFLQLFIDARLQVCMARNSSRVGHYSRVPPEVVAAMHEALEVPKVRSGTWEGWVLSIKNEADSDLDPALCVPT
jgi:gluconate kinase